MPRIYFISAICANLILLNLAANENHYRAAVFEHAMDYRDFSRPKEDILKESLSKYKIAADTAGSNGADIIVFPEFGLYPHDKEKRSWLRGLAENVPDPKLKYSKFNPCNEPDVFSNCPILSKLSCLAKDNNLFLVANLVDLKECLNVETCDANSIESCQSREHVCPEDGVYYHNTNVVFDREGNLIARYYKHHLYFEHDMNALEHPEHTYFETDFGNFTTFVCFDMTFKDSVEAVEKGFVHNVAYPTYWFDHMPSLFVATHFQQSWAITNKVNLLAANVQIAGTGTIGSGIYSSSEGALISSRNLDGQSKLLLSNVPKIPDQDIKIPLNPQKFIIDQNSAIPIKDEKLIPVNDECQINVIGESKDFKNDYRCHSMNVTNYEFLKLTNTEDTISACSNGFCCVLTYNAKSMDENYYLAVSGKSSPFHYFSFGIQACLLIRCESTNEGTCSNFVQNSHTIFEEVELKGTFTTNYIYPFAINSGLKFVERNDWLFDRKSSITYHNTDKESSLLVLALYGRKYGEDKL